jgi:hypothetical protein
VEREPPSLRQVWAEHLAAARFFKPAPPPEVDPQDRLFAALAGLPETTGYRPRASAFWQWLYRLRLAYGVLHTAETAVLWFIAWFVQGPVRTLVAAGAIALVWWHPW